MDKLEMTLTEGWRFHKGDCDDAWFKGFDDSGWRKVLVPHDWSVESPFSRTNSSGTGYLDGGISWYRLHFRLPYEGIGSRVRIVFDGVYKNSQVWCNSYYLGRRPYGYTEFSYDITHAVQFGQKENVIAVRVSHPDVSDSRWFTGSGIYRKVRIFLENPVHPALHGVTFSAENVTRQHADLSVKHEIVNESGEEKTVRIHTELVHRVTKRAAAVMEDEAVIPAGEEAEVILTGAVENPVLWSVEDPILYSLVSWYGTDGEWSFVDEETVGIRKIAFDPDRGFFLNDEPMKIKGVCLHHDGGPLGAAMKAEVWQRRLSVLRACGCNAIRCSHNPHMPELYELCDAMGFLVMDEAFDEWEGPKNKWWQGHNVYPPRHQGYYEDFPEWHERDLRTMVRRDRNHPSVILWSIGNEIDYPNDPYCHPKFETMEGNNDGGKPAAERIYNPDKPNMERIAVLAKELVKIVKEEDTTRPVTLASAFPELSAGLGFLDDVDVIGYNYKEHLYDEDHKRFPEKPIIGSENGKSAEAWQAVLDRDYIAGQFLWTGIDFLGEAKGWPVYCSQAGLLTTDAFPKDIYYERAKLWGGEAKKPLFSDTEAMGAEVSLWRESDRITSRRFEDASEEIGYIFQIIVELKDQEGNRTTDDRTFRVQVEGTGELLAIDSGCVSDLTPFAESYRRTQDGNMVVYVRRTGHGDINVHLICIDEEKCMLKGRRFHLSL